MLFDSLLVAIVLFHDALRGVDRWRPEHDLLARLLVDGSLRPLQGRLQALLVLAVLLLLAHGFLPVPPLRLRGPLQGLHELPEALRLGLVEGPDEVLELRLGRSEE